MEEKTCKDCGKEHMGLEEALNTLKRKHRRVIAGYFGSLLLFAFCLSNVFGFYGGLAVAAGFGVYFFHINMRYVGGKRELLERAKTEDEAIQLFNNMEKEKSKIVPSGQYL